MIFSNVDVIRRVNADFVPVALKAGLINNPPDNDEGRLYREIGRSKILPQGVCVVNSAGKVLDWVFDLAQTRVVGLDTSNALGMPDFGDKELFVLEHLLRDKSDDEIRRAFAAESADADPAAIEAALTKVREAVIFRPLLAT